MRRLPSRAEQLQRLRDQMFDLVVIGGGATGAGIALDALTRGLSVALIERDDFASGTSSRSTKLLHGGVRYLERAIKHFRYGEFSLVTEALHERKTLIKLAPHLTRPLALLTPVYDWHHIPYYWAGLKIYDWIAGRAGLGHSRFLWPQKAIHQFPMLQHHHLRGAIVYYDGQFDDARLNLAVILTAVTKGGVAVNHLEATELMEDGVRGRDQLSGQEIAIRGKVTVNATGPFADNLRTAGGQVESLIAPSLGVHLVLDARFSSPNTGLLIPKTEDGRVLFLLPWEGGTLVGTTDATTELTASPRPKTSEVDYLLRHVGHYLETEVTRQHIRSAWAGIRPLIRQGHAGNTASMSRDHFIEVGPSGLITTVGGKWTTYRRMALDTVDRAVQVGSLKPLRPSQTETTYLEGAQGFCDLPTHTPAHLAHTYGGHTPDVLKAGSMTPLATGYPFGEAQVIHAVQAEYACTPADVLARRIRLAFLDQAAARQALPRVAELMAPLLNWSEVEKKRQVDTTHLFLDTFGL